MRLATRRHWVNYGSALRFAAIFGGVFGTTAGAVMLRPPLAGALFGLLSAVADSLLIMALIGAMEIFGPRTRFGRALARKPFAVTVLARTAAYLAVVALVIGGAFGPHIALFALGAGMAGQLLPQIDAAFPPGLLIVVSGMIVFLLVGVRHLSTFVGEQNARNVVLGRYHRPRAEERFFLFLDIVGSTPVAERLGPLAVHRYLDRTFQAASDPVDDCRGEVFQYVGDEMVVTWTVAEGAKDARPLACLFAIAQALAEAAPEFERDFGTAPRLRAALHAGEVVTGEIGGSRRAIVFHGDVMNATSRIENLTRTLGHPFLVSEDALARLEGKDAYAVTDLGPQELRGREAPLRVYAVAAKERSKV